MWMHRALTRREVTLDEAVQMVSQFHWLQIMQKPEIKAEEIAHVLGNSHSVIKEIDNSQTMITYEEFKVTRSHLVDNQPIVLYLKNMLTNTGFERSRYAIGQASKYFRIVKGEKEHSNLFQI